MNPLSAHRTASITAALLTGAAIVGCLDFTPVTSVYRDSGVSNDSAADGQSTASTGCLDCAKAADTAGGCATEFGQCSTLAPCQATIECVVARCFDPNVNIEQCLVSCETQGGIASTMGPSNVAFAALLQCMATRCQALCLR